MIAIAGALVRTAVLRRAVVLTLAGAAALALAAAPSGAPRASVAGYSFAVVRQYARATDAFTQGLVFHRGRLYEGTGLYGQSSLRELSLDNGVVKTVRSRLMPEGLTSTEGQQKSQTGRLADYGYSPNEISRRQASGAAFGEGIAILAGRVYQLTWTEGVCLVWELSNWSRPIRVFSYSGEGWGLTHDGTHLIMSDGSAALQFRDPATFKVVRSVTVRDPRSGEPVTQLNELEYVKGKVFANVYGTRRVAIIDPRTGRLDGIVFFDGQGGPDRDAPALMPRPLWNQLDARWEVLNGIAYDAATDHLYVTGKKWPAIYEVTIRKVTDALEQP